MIADETPAIAMKAGLSLPIASLGFVASTAIMTLVMLVVGNLS